MCVALKKRGIYNRKRGVQARNEATEEAKSAARRRIVCEHRIPKYINKRLKITAYDESASDCMPHLAASWLINLQRKISNFVNAP